MSTNSVEVYGEAAAAGLAAALAARGVGFDCEPRPCNFYRFAVRHDAAGVLLDAHLPKGTGWRVRLFTDPSAGDGLWDEGGWTEHAVTAMDHHHAVWQAVCERWAGEADRAHLIEDELPFRWEAAPVVGGEPSVDQRRTGSHDVDNPW